MSCPLSFPFDFMHLLYKNIAKLLIAFWCGTFKDIDHAGEDYYLGLKVWQVLGEATAATGRTTPLAYGPAIPNLSKEGVRITANMYGFWFQFLGPVLLERVFNNQKVYKHFVKLITIINRCLQFAIRRSEVAQLREDVAKWVEEYEQ